MLEVTAEMIETIPHLAERLRLALAAKLHALYFDAMVTGNDPHCLLRRNSHAYNTRDN